jgi:hypothetical protein
MERQSALGVSAHIQFLIFVIEGPRRSPYCGIAAALCGFNRQ